LALLTGEHVPRVFIATLRSNGYEVVEARAVFGKATDDEELLRYSGDHGHLLITHDRKDFSGELSDTVEHAEIIVTPTRTTFATTRRERLERSRESSLTIHSPDSRTNWSGSTSGVDRAAPQPLNAPRTSHQQ
jgi:predicted nuclease of predicted toxin-antitoxin system